jgi:protein-arginine deiminase
MMASGSNQPFLMASSIDPVEEVLVVASPLQAGFAEELAGALEGFAPLTQISPAWGDAPSDLWIQDALEIGWRLGGGTISLASLPPLRGGHGGFAKALDAGARAFCSGRGIEIVLQAEPRETDRWFDWYGNLEVSPPCTSAAGREFPYGRILTARQRDMTMHPQVLEFLEEQAIQCPLLMLDASWLTIGHVDELVQFLPSSSARRTIALLPSPHAARVELERALREGATYEPREMPAPLDRALSLDELIDVARSEENRLIEMAMGETADILATGLGLDEEDFRHVPAVFHEGVSVTPNPVNCLSVNGLAVFPALHGPVLDGEDVLQRCVERLVGSRRCRPVFIDQWDAQHMRHGEVHCATNAIRRPGWAF